MKLERRGSAASRRSVRKRSFDRSRLLAADHLLRRRQTWRPERAPTRPARDMSRGSRRKSETAARATDLVAPGKLPVVSRLRPV
jgi:hypothetical protein